jgi:hypothetical protein
VSRPLIVAAIVFAIAASACARHASDPQTLADDTTRAIYNADLDGTVAHFDDALKGDVTRGTLGEVSDEMHALGAYHGLKPVSSDPDKGRYNFQATFDKGSLIVEMRLDPDQKIGAYHVVPQAAK